MKDNSLTEDWDDLSIPDFTDMQKYAFVTQRAINNNYIGYCYRESSEFKIDSGWRFLYGDEDEAYLDNPENTQTKSIAEIIEWKPETKSILSAKRDSDFEWDNDKKEYRQLS